MKPHAGLGASWGFSVVETAKEWRIVGSVKGLRKFASEPEKGVGNLFLIRGWSRILSSKAAGESKLEAYSLGSAVRRIRSGRSYLGSSLVIIYFLFGLQEAPLVGV